MRALGIPIVTTFSLLAVGCGPGPDGGSASSEAATEASASGTVTETVDDGSSGEPPAACEPPPQEDLRLWISIDDDDRPLDAPDGNPYVYQCQIAQTTPDGNRLTLALTCIDGEHSVVIDAIPAVSFDPSGDFELSVIHTVMTFGGLDLLLTLRRTNGELVLAAGQSPVPPDDATIPAGFFDPFAISVLEGVCPVEPATPDDCGALERQALRFEHAGAALELHDGSVGELSSYTLVVDQAAQYHEIECADAPERYYAWFLSPTAG